MYDFIMPEDSELMDVILDDPHISMREVMEREVIGLVPKTRREYNKNYHKNLKRTIRQRSC